MIPKRAAASDPVDMFAASLPAGAAEISPARAEAVAKEVFGRDAVAERLTGERDQNFRLKEDDGDYLLKISHPAEDQAAIDLMTAALRHLERHAPELPCPRVIPTTRGESHALIPVSASERSVVRLLTWLPGKPVRASRRSKAQRAACGAVAGRLVNALSGFSHEAGRRSLIWDLRRFPDVRRLLDDIPEMPCAEAAAHFFERYRAAAAPIFDGLRRQIVHNDLNAKNLIVSPQDEAHVTGIIDFGDMLETAVAADAAIGASAHIRDVSTLEEDLADFLTAYDAHAPLVREEWHILNWLIAARRIADVVIPYWYRKRAPGTAHYTALDREAIEGRLEIVEALAKLKLGA
jgi:Ser/Thr protein kinase RdoA (MazF antagonist)